MERTLDYIPRYDERSRSFPVTTATTDRKWRYWWPGPVLDQGREGACVGHGIVGALMASPDRAKISGQPAAFGVYRLAQHIDQWEGENYSGTSVLAGAKVAKMVGLATEYRWCFGMEQVRYALLEEGPVVIGIPWHSGMYSTDSHGRVNVSGEKVGGHCVYLTGYSEDRRIGGEAGPWIKMRNSWGKGYGKYGSGYFREADLAQLLAQGEACVLVQP